MSEYRDDVPNEEGMRYSTPPLDHSVGQAGGDVAGESVSLPIGLHYTAEQRREHRLHRAGIVIVRRALR